jgi:hypothetical protein
MASTPARRSLSRRLGLAVCAAGLSLGLAEVVVRVAMPERWDAEVMAETSLSTLTRYSADPVLYLELIPGLSELFGKGVVVTDADGKRGLGAPGWQPEGTDGEPLRIDLLGDSTSFVWRLPYEQGYPERVRRGLAEAWGRPVQLVNHSVPGYNSEQELRLFERDVLPARPDLVVWHYDHNDAVPALLGTQQVGMPPDYGDNALGSALVKVIRRELRRAEAEDQRMGADMDQDELTEMVGAYLSEGRFYDEHLLALERVGALALEHDVPVLVVIFDAGLERADAPDEHYERLHEPLLTRLDAAGLGVFDLYDTLQATLAAQDWDDMRPLQLSDRDRHPNKIGHRVVADAILAHLLGLPGGADGPPALR